MAKSCAVVGAGDFFETAESVEKTDMLIAADGGYAALKKIGLTPDVLIGDFDSLSETPDFDKIVRLPKEKDDTDMMAAVKTGLKEGCRVFYLYGGTGGRFDHTMANVQTLSFLADNGAKGFLIGKDAVATVVRDGEIGIKREKDGYVSVFCLSDRAEGVSLSGLKYSMENGTLTNGFPLGVSNEFAAGTAHVRVQKGALLVLWPRSRRA